MITEEQVNSGAVKEGTRVYYAKKDGTRIYGVVRNIYVDQKKLSMKPDKQHDDDPAYAQTYRFRRLTVDGKVEFFGIQVAPLVAVAGLKSTPQALQRVFSCEAGLFVTDGKKVFLEKIKGLPRGVLNDPDVWDQTRIEVLGRTFDDSMIKKGKHEIIDEVMECEPGKRPAVKIKVNQVEFNRFLKDIPYSTGQYYAKSTDVATMIVSESGIEVNVFDKHQELCGVYSPEQGTVISHKGKATVSYMLYDFRDVLKNCRTKQVEIWIYADGTMWIETEEQRRILWPLDHVQQKSEHRSEIRARKKNKTDNPK